jgi:hypothetical protein
VPGERYRLEGVIPPYTVLCRVEQVLEPTKDKVLRTYSENKDELDKPGDLAISGQAAALCRPSVGLKAYVPYWHE